MAATPVAKVTKVKPKKTLKRLMLASSEGLDLVRVSEAADDLIASELSTHFKQFSDREEARRNVMLGLNTITRSAELCTDNLKAVLLNANTRPQRLIIHLQQLCIYKGIPVAAVQSMEKIAQSLQGSVKGLKTNITAVGILGDCAAPVLKRVLDNLPPVQLRSVEEVQEKAKRATIVPPPKPEVYVKAYHIQVRDGEDAVMDADLSVEGSSRTRRPAGHFSEDLLDLTETSIPFVDYNSFIGSSRPLSKRVCLDKPSKSSESGPSTSGYKPPIIKLR